MSINRWSKENQKLENLVPSTEPKEYYSTEETLTNKVWIDGKPIYRCVVVKNNPNQDSGVFDTTNKEIISFNGYLIRDNVIKIPLSFSPTILSYAATIIQSSDNKIYVYWGSSITITKAVLILEYTKTE